MKNQLEGKVIAITGAAGGIGAGAVKLFVERGARVLAVDYNIEAAQAVVAALPPGTARSFKADISSKKDVEAYTNAAVEAFGHLDGVVLNAGIYAEIKPIETFSQEAFDRVYEVNQRGTWLGIKAATPHLRAQGGGSIVITASIQGLAATPGTCAYNATKHSNIGVMRCASMELAREGIRVNIVNPGFIETNMLNGFISDAAPGAAAEAKEIYREKIPMGRYGRPDEIAKMMAFLSSDDASYCCGNYYNVDGGVMAALLT